MDPKPPNSSLELDPTRTELISVSTPPATAAAVNNPNPFIEKEEKKEKRKVRLRGKTRTDSDRPRHMTRADEIEHFLAEDKEPLALQVYQAMQRVHRRFSRVKLAERRVAARWKEARLNLEVVSGTAYDLVAYCARQVRQPSRDTWEGRTPIDPVEVEKRVKNLFNGFLPSDLRTDLSNLRETLENLERILQQDPDEAGRWDSRFIDAVQQCAPSLRRAILQTGQARRSYGAALNRLRGARAEWDLHWTVFEALVLGRFELKGRKADVEKVFEPVRLRGSARLNGKKPPDPSSG